jgi:transmembrane sensor
MTEPSREMIERYLRNECSAEEAEYVKEWVDAGKEAGIPPAVREEMRANVYNATRPVVNNVIPARQLWMRAIAAACFIGLVIVGYQLILPVRPKTASAPFLADASAKPAKTVTNAGNNTMKFTVSDGSTIELAAHSEVSYEESFTAGSRDLRLKGEAVFVVAKDPIRPFTVYAGGIATTALGTSFRVRAVDSESRVSVELLTGKVSVHPETGVAKMYLSPGQVMIFDKDRQSMTLNISHNANTVASALARNSTVPKGSTSETNESWAFYNQALPEILRTLQMAYTTKISYSSRDLSKIRFTGTFSKTDSLSYILNTIGSISKLQVNKNDSCYRMEK